MPDVPIVDWSVVVVVLLRVVSLRVVAEPVLYVGLLPVVLPVVLLPVGLLDVLLLVVPVVPVAAGVVLGVVAVLLPLGLEAWPPAGWLPVVVPPAEVPGRVI